MKKCVEIENCYECPDNHFSTSLVEIGNGPHRPRTEIKSDIPVFASYDDNYEMEGHRNTQRMLTLILEVALDLRDIMVIDEMKKAKKKDGG